MMPGKAEAKKPYSVPSFKRLDAATAKAVLETQAVPGDAGAGAMLELIRNPKTKLRSGPPKSFLNR
jgi:hypothetical protein